MKFFPQILMSVIFLAILAGANIYLSRRIGWIFSMDSRTGLHILFALLPIFMVGGMIGFSNATGFFGSLLYGAAAVITGLLLYLLLSLLVVDLLRIFVQLKPALYGILSFTIALAVVFYGLWNATRTRVTEVDVAVENLEEEVRIMHLSDIHLGHFRGKAFLQKLVEMTNAADPEMVVITGDLFDGKVHLKQETLEPLQQLRVPVFFVEGNHDGYSGVEKIKELLRVAGVRVLENEVTEVEGLQLIGLNHMPADDGAPSMHAGNPKSTIRREMTRIELDPKKPSVLLHHSPDGVEFAAARSVDLYLAGHTHAGQLFPINFLNDLLFTYNKGLYHSNGTTILVNRGAGTFGPPMRVGTRGEIVLIRLKAL
jgi:predicted MPP superfamily phosphohydrolase